METSHVFNPKSFLQTVKKLPTEQMKAAMQNLTQEQLDQLIVYEIEAQKEFHEEVLEAIVTGDELLEQHYKNQNKA